MTSLSESLDPGSWAGKREIHPHRDENSHSEPLKSNIMAGYSGTPLAKKLGIKEGAKIALLNAPEKFIEELGPLPSSVEVYEALCGDLSLVLLFETRASVMRDTFSDCANRILQDGMIWVAWPKKASKVPTDLSFDVTQKIGLDAGLVDTKICAINDVWSGLKFVIRKENRK